MPLRFKSSFVAVVDGDLDEFMQAALAQKAFGGGPGQVEDVELGCDAPFPSP